jgi:hypothetical protein
MIQAAKPLQALYTDVRYWEELVDSINQNGGLKEPYVLTSRFKCTLQQDQLKEK